MSALDKFIANARLARKVFTLVETLVEDWMSPNTPANRDSFISGVIALTDSYSIPYDEAMDYAIVLADIVETLAGGKSATDHIVQNLRPWLAKKGHALDAAEEGMIRDLMDKLVVAIQDWRAGKS